MSASDSEYFRERAAVERGLALAALDPRAAAAHQALAKGYDALVREAAKPPSPATPARSAAGAGREPAQCPASGSPRT